MANLFHIDRLTGAITLSALDASRLLSLDASKVVANTDLDSWVTGTANQITVTDDTDGTITLSTPQDIHTGASPAFAGLTIDTTTLVVDATNNRVGIGTAAPALKFDVKGAPNTSFTNCPLLAQVHTTDAYADGMGGGISLGGMYDATHSTTFGYIAGVKDGATISDTAGKLILGARATGGGAPDMAVVTIHGTGVTEIGDGGTTDYTTISGTGDLSFAGSAGFYPRRITQSAEPANGTGATQIDVGELSVWRDPDDNKTYLMYNDTDEGVRKVEMT